MSDSVPRLLLTGAPHSGKTTLACALAERLRADGCAVGGFVTRELRTAAGRLGFQVENFDGRRAVMAHVAWASGAQVGRYRVDVDAFDRIAIPAVELALRVADVIIIDEIGPMELCSTAFTRLAGTLVSANTPLVATVHTGRHPVTDALREHPGTELIDLSAANRDGLLTRLLTRLRSVR